MKSTPIPGAWICRKCDYVLQLRLVNGEGETATDARLAREACPNGHGILVQATDEDRRRLNARL